MKRLIIALIAGAFAVSAAAQTTATTDKDKAKMDRAEKNKAKQEQVQGATTMPEQQSEQPGAYEASQQARPKPPEKKPPWEKGAGRRKILSLGEVIDRSIGAARGAVGVAEGVSA